VFTASAELYDTIYSSFKDYGAEADRIAALLRAEHPACRAILDVGCGTGEHARLLTAHGFQVDGLDLDPRFVGLAAEKNPGSRFYVADLSAFAIGARYDAVLCLFGSIGYAKSVEGVVRALSCARGHLAAGGIVVVEPWLTPEAVRPGHTTSLTVERPPLRVVRTSRLDVAGRMARVTFEYEVARPGGVTHATELHELGLFTVDEMNGAFAAAGLSVSYDPAGLTGRGLYLGRAAGT
jgi:SAM-dependent methyltransferase